MDNSETVSNPTLRSVDLRRPLIPARFVQLGATKSRKQHSGKRVLFVAVDVRIVYTAVDSMLDGYASDWYSDERHWVPFDSLEPGQLQLVRTV